MQEDNAKCHHEKDLTDKRLQKTEIERSKIESELKQALIDVHNAEQKTQLCQKEQFDDKQRIELLLREKNTLARHKESAQEQIRQINREQLVCENSRKQLEKELDAALHSVDDVKNQMEAVEKEKDKYIAVGQELEQKVRLYAARKM